jgi:hypothetical protein
MAQMRSILASDDGTGARNVDICRIQRRFLLLTGSSEQQNRTAHLEIVNRKVRGSKYYANFDEHPERGDACPILALKFPHEQMSACEVSEGNPWEDESAGPYVFNRIDRRSPKFTVNFHRKPNSVKPNDFQHVLTSDVNDTLKDLLIEAAVPEWERGFRVAKFRAQRTVLRMETMPELEKLNKAQGWSSRSTMFKQYSRILQLRRALRRPRVVTMQNILKLQETDFQSSW